MAKCSDVILRDGERGLSLSLVPYITYTETFGSPNGDGIGYDLGSWELLEGDPRTWRTLSGRARTTDSGGAYATPLSAQLDVEGYYVKARIHDHDVSKNIGLLVRTPDTGGSERDGLMIYARRESSTTATLFSRKRTNDSSSDIVASYLVDWPEDGTPFDFVVEVRNSDDGDRLRCWADGCLVFDQTSTESQFYGYTGFGIYTSHQNNQFEEIYASTAPYRATGQVTHPLIANADDDVTISGLFGNSLVGDAEYRLVSTDNTVDWTTLESSITDGKFSGTVSLPAGGEYTVSVRLRNGGVTVDTVTSSSTMKAGDVFIAMGASNISGRGDNEQTYVGTKTAWMVNEDGDIAELADPWSNDTGKGEGGGSFGPLLGNLIEAAEDVHPIFILSGSGGTGISAWDDSPAGAMWTELNTNITNIGLNGVKGVLWMQGGANLTGGSDPISEAEYKTAQANLAASMSSLPGSTPPFICASQGRVEDRNTTTTGRPKFEHWDDGTVDYGPMVNNNDSPADEIHPATDAELAKLAGMWWLAIEDHCYGGSNGRGPRVTGITHSGSAIAIQFDQDIQNTTGWDKDIFDIDFDDGDTRIINLVIRGTSSSLSLILSGSVNGTNPAMTYGDSYSLSDATAVVADSTISLPYTNHGVSSIRLAAEPFWDEPIAAI